MLVYELCPLLNLALAFWGKHEKYKRRLFAYRILLFCSHYDAFAIDVVDYY